MDIEIVTIPKGTLLTISMGHYSDYSVSGVFRVLKDIRPEDLSDFRKGKDVGEIEDLYAIVATMVIEGFIDTLDSTELHLGEYCDYDPMIHD